ncbi:MAG TPA: helix-turn-helix transcriptional regulator [Ferruginibacter sp.]|nr:helix-turn-helix transcriptional regulator [Ferruginibacter sp.]
MKKVNENIYLKAFGANLKKKRKKLGYSQEKLAYESEIELRQIGRIERGEINTGILSVKIIAETLKIDKRELFDF